MNGFLVDDTRLDPVHANCSCSHLLCTCAHTHAEHARIHMCRASTEAHARAEHAWLHMHVQSRHGHTRACRACTNTHAHAEHACPRSGRPCSSLSPAGPAPGRPGSAGALLPAQRLLQPALLSLLREECPGMWAPGPDSSHCSRRDSQRLLPVKGGQAVPSPP